MLTKRYIQLAKVFLFFLITFQFNYFAQQNELQPVSGQNGMVATAHPLASQAAYRILNNGGNAVDAAIAAAFAIGVVEPDGSGLGGGGCMTLYLKNENKTYYINFYQQAPALIQEMKYTRKEDGIAAKTALVPGAVAGLTYALEHYGTRTIKEVTEDAVKYADNGFEIDNTLAGIILDNIEILQKYNETADVFLPDGFPLMQGDTLKQKALAGTLKQISQNGAKGFYEGEIAERIVIAMNAEGNKCSLEDLKNYKVRITEPLKGTYRGYDIYSANAPQSGATLIETLNMFENIDFEHLGHYTESADVLHLMSEVFLRSYADRYEYLGDPEFAELPLDMLTSKSFAEERYKTINLNRTSEEGYRQTNPGSLLDSEAMAHTTHISVVDAEGNMVSLTQTLGTFFGCGFSVEGIIFNSSLINYSSKVEVNQVKGGKQSRSTVSPTIILKDGEPFMCLGTPGGGRIISTLAEIIVNVIDFGMNAEEANQAPRFYCQVNDDYLNLEGRINESIQTDLEKKGHKLKMYEDFDLFFGGAQFVIVDWKNHIYYGTADKRRGGVALGY